MDTKLSRRSLLVGAAATAGIAAGATIASTSHAAEAPSDKQGQWSWLTAPDPIADSDVAKTLDCDILILGAGSGGVPAALYAALHGAKVVVMSKGATHEANGWCWASYNDVHDEECGVAPYDPMAWREKIAARTNGRCNLQMFSNMFDRSGEVAAWIEKAMADVMPVSYMTDNAQGRVNEATHLTYFWAYDGDLSTRYAAFHEALGHMIEMAESEGAEFLWSTPAVQLATNEAGSVVGAYGQQADGTYVKVNASQGTLIATGNVKDDPEMMAYWCPLGAGLWSLTAAIGSHTGDGHKMAQWVGARMDEPPVATGFASTNWGDGVGAFHGQPFLRVNICGERYTREDYTKGSIGENYEGQFIVAQTCYQPEKRCYQIVDSRYPQIVGESKAETFKALVESGDIVKGAALEELAEKIGVPADTLLATVERYNEVAESGQDLDFGVTPEFLELVGGVHEGPFYALEQSGCVGYTIGGIRTNRELQVVSAKNGLPIGGLWVCGNALGGQWGNEFNYESFGATNKMGAVVGGILAVKSMLGSFDEAM